MKKILSIDDEPTMLTCIERILNTKGYEIVTTSDPDEGIGWFKENDDICLALLDIKMPKKNGFEIYEELVSHRKIPVLFVTAYPRSFTTDSDDIVKLWQEQFADGTTDIVYKPFEVDTLLEKVEALIGLAEDLGDDQ